MHLIGTSSVKGFFAQTTGHVNFNLYTIFWSFLTQFSHKLRISSACIRNIIVFHSLNLNSYLYLENDNTIIVNVYLLNILFISSYYVFPDLTEYVFWLWELKCMCNPIEVSCKRVCIIWQLAFLNNTNTVLIISYMKHLPDHLWRGLILCLSFLLVELLPSLYLVVGSSVVN